VLTKPNDPAGAAFPSQGTGSDHASMGIFQQQPWWGTAAQRMEPVASTNLFLDHLLAIRNWRTAPPWQVAQQLQASTYTDGSNYHAQMPRAVSILAAVTANSASLNCGASGMGQLPSSPTGPYGLAAGCGSGLSTEQAGKALRVRGQRARSL
jgi:hypothetical protein